MTANKIMNAPSDLIEDYIAGLVAGSPGLARVGGWPVVVRSPADRKQAGRVAIVTGGGSGHEPAHAGFVGPGMLDAAVLGPVFTSPSVDAIHAAITSVATDAGVLLVVKNYTGDRLNFGLAAELAKAEGIPVETVLVADDAALGDASGAGRRGLTSTVLVHKIAGAAAERGWPIQRIAAVAQRFLERSATMGVALSACHVPGAAAPNFVLGEGEVEWGLGIHGEPGRERGALPSARQIAAALVDEVARAIQVRREQDVVVLVNSLGGTTDLELRILTGGVLAELDRRGLRVRLAWTGPFLTSLDMAGASVTVAAVDEELVGLLADPAAVVAFPHSAPLLDPGREVVIAPARAPEATGGPAARVDSTAGLHAVAAEICAAVIAAEEPLTALDRQVGDGDLGTNLARGARTITAKADDLLSLPTPTAYLRALAGLARREIGGTSGPLYSILLMGVAESLEGVGSPAPSDWAEAFASGVAQVGRIGGARPGQRTMIDALVPAAETLTAGGSAQAAAAAARDAADATAHLTAALGRSSYLGDRALGVPDPGAIAVAIQLQRLAEALASD